MSNKPTWIWYPGDFEVWLGNRFNNRRTERGSMFPPFWKQDAHWPTVEFTTTAELADDEDISIAAEGDYNLAVDGKLQTDNRIPQGRHRLSIKVWNQASPPALFVSGRSIGTDDSWLTTYEDKIWIDENGVAHGAGIYVHAGSWNFDSPDTPPSQYRLLRRQLLPVGSEPIGPSDSHDGSDVEAATGMLYDFGREVFGYLILTRQEGTICVYYGESREEALDKAHCETLDILRPGHRQPQSKAFRFVYIETAPDGRYADVLMDFEYAPSTAAAPATAAAALSAVSPSDPPAASGSFRCSDPLLNRIWEVSAYTLDLTTREFFVDGIKRDRWTWSGDAIQSYLMNYYLRFDTPCVRRTIRQLRGKDPVTAHVNTIMDYTFYWFKSVLDYYQYTGDTAFVSEMWPRMVTLMDYVLGRTNRDGMAEGKADDWLFIDWVDFPMHKRGTLCFEQILLYKALETMAVCARLVSSHGGYSATLPHPDYAALSTALRNRIKQTFWSYGQKAYLHAIEDGRLNPQVTKFPNMFAILYGLSYEEERKEIMKSVMLNPAVDPITTPYMRFYELETLCMDGRFTEVLQEMRDYWGGMLGEGATSFWEKYVPTERGTQHLAMYGRPYGKSLCHAWGASPIYLLGKYYLGVRPTKPGYAEYEVHPALGGLDWLEGDVPMPGGSIHVRMDRRQVTVSATAGHGWLCVAGRRVEIEANKEVTVQF